MSFEITTSFVEQYKANIQMLSQQKGSKLRNAVRVETIVGENAFFEQVGSVEARKRTSRHSDTPRMDTPHSRRRVTPVDFDWADLIDQADKVRLLADPTSSYALAASWAMGRAIDNEIVAAADGVAQTGKTGSTATAFDSANMEVGVQIGSTNGSTDVGLNIGKLIEASENLFEGEVDEEMPRYIALNARQLSSLLRTTETTSADFNTVKALVKGEIDQFMGFTFLRTQRIVTNAGGDDKVLYWAHDGILLAIGQDATARITERADKNYATQVFYSQTIGATRMEEAKVGRILCDPAASPLS